MKVQAPSRQEEVALFRLAIVGDLLSRELARGDLEAALKERAIKHRYRPPGASRTRTFSWKTLQRWYYAAKAGPHHLEPRSRRKGFAGRLSSDQKP